MESFAKLLHEYRNWAKSFPAVALLLPYSLPIMFGSIAVDLLYELAWTVFRRYFYFLGLLDTIAHFGFLLGFWLTLVTKEIKWAPYGLFASVFVLLFPFTSFTLFSILKSAIFLFFGYWLLKFTASSEYAKSTDDGVSA